MTGLGVAGSVPKIIWYLVFGIWYLVFGIGVWFGLNQTKYFQAKTKTKPKPNQIVKPNPSILQDRSVMRCYRPHGKRAYPLFI